LKKAAARKKRREIFVLTPEEKRTISFVLVALLLGVTAKRYRESHSVPPAKTAIADTARSAGLPAQKRAEAKKRKLAQ
jgi:hypothetical protein